ALQPIPSGWDSTKGTAPGRLLHDVSGRERARSRRVLAAGQAADHRLQLEAEDPLGGQRLGPEDDNDTNAVGSGWQTAVRLGPRVVPGAVGPGSDGGHRLALRWQQFKGKPCAVTEPEPRPTKQCHPRRSPGHGRARMGWATQYIAKLQQGASVQFRPRG